MRNGLGYQVPPNLVLGHRTRNTRGGGENLREIPYWMVCLTHASEEEIPHWLANMANRPPMGTPDSPSLGATKRLAPASSKGPLWERPAALPDLGILQEPVLKGTLEAGLIGAGIL